jgi:hypothetical protein
MTKLELSSQDLQNIVALCDLAIRTEGMRVVETVYPLAQKIKAHLEELAKEAKTEE